MFCGLGTGPCDVKAPVRRRVHSRGTQVSEQVGLGLWCGPDADAPHSGQTVLEYLDHVRDHGSPAVASSRALTGAAAHSFSQVTTPALATKTSVNRTSRTSRRAPQSGGGTHD